MTAGTCRFCRCTEDNVCHLPDGEPCSWLTADRTVCNAPACIRAHQAELARKEGQRQRRTRKRTPAEIYQLKMQEKRERARQYRANAKARRKGRAA